MTNRGDVNRRDRRENEDGAERRRRVATPYLSRLAGRHEGDGEGGGEEPKRIKGSAKKRAGVGQ